MESSPYDEAYQGQGFELRLSNQPKSEFSGRKFI